MPGAVRVRPLEPESELDAYLEIRNLGWPATTRPEVWREQRRRAECERIPGGRAVAARRRSIYTANNTRNAPMLALNQSLGYSRLSGTVVLARPGK